MTADRQLKAFIDRVLRLKEEQDTLSDDIREVYAEAKAQGYDKTVMGKLVAHLRKIEKSGADAVEEAESIFDTYLTAYHRASGTAVATHTHEEEQFDPITGVFLDDNVSAKLVATVATGMQTEAGRAALTAAVDIMIAREEAEEDPVANVGEGAADESAAASDDPASRATEESERQRASMVGFADDCRTGGKEQSDASAAPVGDAVTDPHGIPATLSESAPASQGEAEVPSVDRETQPSILRGEDSPDAKTGGDHVTAHPDNAATADGLVRHTPSATIPKTAKDYRPNCLKPDACGASGLQHCYSCRRAMQDEEAA
jgi:uncharacterized protein (UPF0335 family)